MTQKNLPMKQNRLTDIDNQRLPVGRGRLEGQDGSKGLRDTNHYVKNE